MNPQNCASHIPLRHTLLWRKSMFAEKDVPNSHCCHKQLNEFSSRTNESWRTRNNFIHTNLSNVSRGVSQKTKRSKVNEVFDEERRQSLMRSLFIDKEQMQRSEKLIDGMSNLKQKDLMTNKNLVHAKLPGVMRAEHIYNDYHTHNTNPGYSRSELGRIFSK